MKLFELIGIKDFDETVQILKEDCQPFIKEGLPILYRGMKLNSPRIKKVNSLLYSAEVRKDRKAMDSSPELHAMLNKFFKSKMGIPMRSEAVFCSGHHGKAAEYAPGFFAQVILPIGEFKYTWSPSIDDAYDRLQLSWFGGSPWSELIKTLVKIGESLNLTRDQMETANQELRLEMVQILLDEYGDEFYKFNEDLNRAADSSNEIMIACDSYYILDHNEHYDFNDVLKKVKS